MPARAARRVTDPIYVKIATEFRRQIENGVLRVGDKLPSVRALRRGRRISAATAMEAYMRLERDGFVTARDRSGFYVLDPQSARYPRPEASKALVPPVPVGISR